MLFGQLGLEAQRYITWRGTISCIKQQARNFSTLIEHSCVDPIREKCTVVLAIVYYVELVVVGWGIHVHLLGTKHVGKITRFARFLM